MNAHQISMLLRTIAKDGLEETLNATVRVEQHNECFHLRLPDNSVYEIGVRQLVRGDDVLLGIDGDA